MAMNWIHRRICSSEKWAASVRDEMLPWALLGVELGDSTLEIGPGYGANLKVLVERTERLTAVEIDPAMAAGLRRSHGSRARIVEGDGTDLDLPDSQFSSVVCFTMLHHVPTPHGQNELFAEARRVLEPGGVFAGCDLVHSLFMRALHIGDTYNPVPPQSLARRLETAGFQDVFTDEWGGRQRWRAVAA
ncbi:MAG: class I SAM-dependent methyltransferase [Segniliparus sp.]|uniref:class I SAM-dependent methyltransferase n=1 Tax=Segniliparus sp. TaxID=2804064 RepID=UPI003F3A9B7D